MRTVTIALVAGTVVSLSSHGGVAWPLAVLVMLWPSLGGHFVELWYLNWLRPRLGAARGTHMAARVGAWFAGGALFVLCMTLTTRALAGGGAAQWPAWWIGGLGFIGIELVVHLGLLARRQPCFYDGRG